MALVGYIKAEVGNGGEDSALTSSTMGKKARHLCWRMHSLIPVNSRPGILIPAHNAGVFRAGASMNSFCSQ